MRKAITLYFAVVVLSAVIFLVAVPQETQCQDPLSIAKNAVSLLTPFLNSSRSSSYANRGTEDVKIQVWMHNGDPNLNGCGFYFMVTGYSGGSGHDYFPSEAVHICGNENYRMRMTSQGAVYDKEVYLGKEKIKTIEVHADGWYNTYANVMCFKLNEKSSVGTKGSFCINNLLLNACKFLLNKWNNIDIDWQDIMITRTQRGAHKIKFSDIGMLVKAYEILESNGDGDRDALLAVCHRIDLEPGYDSPNSWDCPANKVKTAFHGAGISASLETRWVNENKNPYGCDRNTYY